MSAESPRHGRASVGGPLTVASQPPSDRSLIDTVSGFLNDVSLSGSPAADARDTIQWAHFETADINEPAPEGDHDAETAPLLLVLGYGSGVQVWLIPPNGEAQEVLSWRQGSVRALRILPTPAAGDSFAAERPLLALCDSAGPQPLYCSLSFISLRRGEQVKSIKFKNPILDVLANKQSVVVSFSERFAVFDAGTLEDRLSVTTCYPCPCPLGGAGPINPLALGDRWLAYADKKLNATKRSSGGCEGEGVTSYTATVLHAAKSLSKGLRGLGETVASSLAGGRTLSQSPSPPNADHQQPGVVTILDIEGPGEDDNQEPEEMWDATVAHFVAHSDAIIALRFDASGMLLVTADKRGHDFHVFRVQPHPCHPSLAAVHHLYILHRGDTTAKVQDIAISADSRWAAVSTLRGTTHVFPVSPYGGACGVRTHTQPRVVNRLSRFHRSAGLPIHAHNARSSSPVGDGIAQGAWYPNPRLPPYPLPTTAGPLAQLRPMPAAAGLPTHTITRNSSGRQRLSSLSEDGGGVPLLACARWGAAPPAASARSPAAHALYVMAATGHLLHYLVHPRPAAGVAKEKVCEDTPVELGVELVAQWPLSRPPAAPDAAAPLPSNNPLLQRHHYKGSAEMGASEEERWLAQVEIVTHAGPHRRLWMGPQFVFKTYNATLSGSCSLLEAEAVEVEAVGSGAGAGAARSPPVNMPGARPLVPVLIDSGSTSSLEHSPSDSFRRKSFLLEAGSKPVGDKALGDVQLREDLAEAMRETEHGGSLGVGAEVARRVASVARAVDPQGTVVAPGEETEVPEANDDPDLYTQANTDEALFRPVVRAPAALPSPSEMTASPLPAGTTIPVQNLLQSGLPPSPNEQSMPLNSEVVIPAALRYQHPVVTANMLEKEKPSVKQSSLETDIVVSNEIITLTPSIEGQPTVVEKMERIDRPAELSISENIYVDVSVLSTVVEVKAQDDPNTREVLNETVNAEKPVKFAKGSIKGKGRDRRSVTPLKTDEPTKLYEQNQPKPIVKVDIAYSGNKSKLESLLKSEVHVELPVFSPKPSLRKPYHNTINNEEKVLEHVHIKHIAVEEDFVEPSKVDSTELKQVSKFDNEAFKVSEYKREDEHTKVESMGDTSLTKTEDQIWAMLSENTQETVKTTITQTKKVIDDVKSKPRKSKKNRTRLPMPDSNTVISQETDDCVKEVSYDDQNTTSEDFNVQYKKPLQDKTITTSQIEESLVAPDKLSKGFIKAKSLSPETSIDAKHIKHAADQKKTCSIYNEDWNCLTEFSPVIEDTESTKADLPTAAKYPVEDFDLPIDFNSYFVSKDEKLKAESNVSKRNDEAIIKEILGDSVLSLQTNNFKKPSRKERQKHDDFVSVDKSERIKIDGPYESKKFPSLIIDIDKERTSTPGSKIRVKEPEIIVMESAMEDFPSIGSSRNMRSYKKRLVLPQEASSKSISTIPPIKSYSSIAAVSTKTKEINPEDFLGLELSENILEPPKPCRPSLHEKLVELCKITDIAVAECDAPDDLSYMDDDQSSAFELPPLEFSLDEFKLEVMRDSLLDIGDKKLETPISKTNVGDILFDIKDMASKNVDAPVKHKTAIKTSAVDQDFNLVYMKSECETKSALKVDTVVSEVMEKSSDDDNTSPVSSHTDSDEKEDKKNTATSSSALPTQKSSAKKKSRQKKKK